LLTIKNRQIRTMKHLIIGIFVVLGFASCSKEASTPQTVAEVNKAISYRDANIAISQMQASNNGKDQVSVNFTTLYEQGVAKIELMSGDSQNYLCSIYSVDLTGNSAQNKNYIISDTHPKASTMYYMVRFTLNNGDWGYTDVLKFNRGN